MFKILFSAAGLGAGTLYLLVRDENQNIIYQNNIHMKNQLEKGDDKYWWFPQNPDDVRFPNLSYFKDAEHVEYLKKVHLTNRIPSEGYPGLVVYKDNTKLDIKDTDVIIKALDENIKYFEDNYQNQYFYKKFLFNYKKYPYNWRPFNYYIDDITYFEDNSQNQYFYKYPYTIFWDHKEWTY